MSRMTANERRRKEMQSFFEGQAGEAGKTGELSDDEGGDKATASDLDFIDDGPPVEEEEEAPRKRGPTRRKKRRRLKSARDIEDSEEEEEDDEEKRAEAVRETVTTKAAHEVQRTKTRGATVASRDFESVAPPKPEDGDDGLWRPAEDFDFAIRVSGSKMLSETLKAALVNMSDQCSVLLRAREGFQGLIVHAQDLAQGPTVVIRAKVACEIEGPDGTDVKDLDETSLSCSSKPLQRLVARGAAAGGSMTLYKIKNEELLRCHAGDEKKGSGFEFDGGIALTVSEGGVPPIPPITNQVSISMPTRIVAQVFKDAIIDSKLSDGSGDSNLVLVNVSYDQYEDDNKGQKVFVGRLILAYDMGSSLQAVSMLITFTPTQGGSGGSYTVIPNYPVDEDRLEPLLSHNVRAPVVAPMLSALGSRGRVVISASSSDQKIVLRSDMGTSSVTMIVGTTPDPEED